MLEYWRKIGCMCVFVCAWYRWWRVKEVISPAPGSPPGGPQGLKPCRCVHMCMPYNVWVTLHSALIKCWEEEAESGYPLSLSLCLTHRQTQRVHGERRIIGPGIQKTLHLDRYFSLHDVRTLTLCLGLSTDWLAAQPSSDWLRIWYLAQLTFHTYLVFQFL